jgi:hypothetical protein
MLIPNRNLSDFVRETTNQCFSSRQNRLNQNMFFQTYFESGSDDTTKPAMFNKTFASCDDLESLLYSPVSLRFALSDPDNPNLLNKMKGRVASARIRNKCRRADIDTMISQAVNTAMVKGKGFIKTLVKGKDATLNATLVEPEDMGVLRENYTVLDQDMEAFSHRTMITIWQFERILKSLHWDAKDEAKARERARNYQRPDTGDELKKSTKMTITTGGMYPFQPAGGGPAQNRGIADWLSAPKPSLAPEVEQILLPYDETWIWDDDRDDWTTFSMIEDMLLLGRFQKLNVFAYDTNAKQSSPFLKGEQPFCEFCINPTKNYFWGSSELRHLVTLQEAITARVVGINKMLRKEEDPTRTFTGTAGVNQVAMSRYNKPGGYYVDANPQAKINTETLEVSPDAWHAVNEFERMFDDTMGLPPTARGKGDQGVRSHRHAEALVRQASPRFKDRALLVERSVEGLGGKVLDLMRAHDHKRMTAWVPQAEAGLEGIPPDELTIPPAKGLIAVPFRFYDIPEDVHLLVDSHSSSPAFSEEAKVLNFDLLKVGAEGKDDLLEHVDVSNPEDLEMSAMRRDIAAAEAEQRREAAGILTKGKKH